MRGKSKPILLAVALLVANAGCQGEATHGEDAFTVDTRDTRSGIVVSPEILDVCSADASQKGVLTQAP